MMALAYIIFISVSVLGATRMLLPSDLKPLLSQREFAAVVMLPAMATFSPNYLIFAVAVTGFISLIPATPEQRLRLLLFCIPLLPTFQLFLVLASTITLVQLSYPTLLMLGFFPVAVMHFGSKRGAFGKEDAVALLLWLVFLFIAARGAAASGFARSAVQAMLAILLPYYIFSRGFAATQRPTHTLLPLVFAAAIIGAIATFESTRHWLLYSGMDVGSDPAAFSSYAKQREGYLRASTTFGESTSQSIFLALALVVLIAMRKHFRRRAVFYLLTTLLCSGLVFAFARVGWITVAVGLTACLWAERRRLVVLCILVGAPLGWALLVQLASAIPLIGAALGIGLAGDGSADYRILLSKRIFEVWRHHPILGISSADIPLYLEDMRQGEGIIDLVNAPLAIALQSGLFGLTLFLLAVGKCMLSAYAGRKLPDPEWRALSIAAFSALVALNAALVTTSLQNRNFLWLIMLVGMSSSVALRSVRTAAMGQLKPHIFSAAARAKEKQLPVAYRIP